MSIGWLSRKIREARSDERGLTLVEMIITVLILAMITGVLSAAFVTSIRSAANSSQRTNETNDAQLIATFLTRDAQATGGTDSSTGQADPTLGVSPTDPAGCAVPGTVVARFKWIDRSATALPDVVRVANYSWLASDAGGFSAQQLVRTTCFGSVGAALGAPKSLALANLVQSAPTLTCNDGQSCAALPFPDTISLTVTAQNADGTTPYTYTLTASVRPQNTAQATPTVPAPLILLGRSTCADGTTGLGYSSSLGVTVNVSGRAFIDAADSGSCEALSTGTLFNDFNADELNVLTGGSCSGSGCPAAINHYTTPIADPFANLPTPSESGQPVFNTTSCNGTLSPGVYTSTVTVTNGNSCTLNPGVYILRGGMSVTLASQLTGTGVLLYIPDPAHGGSANATFNTNGAANIELTPPTSGAYAGINIWQAGTSTVLIGLTVGIFFSNDVNILGTIYAPNTQVRDVASFLGGTVNFGGVVAQTLVVNTSFISTLNINPLQIALPDSLPQWTVNRPGYSAQLIGSGGLPPYTYSLQSGSLPAGLTMSSTTGAITGTPTSAGTANFTARITDGFGDSVTRQYSIVINPPPAIATTLPNWTRGFTYNNVQLSTNGTGTSPYTFAVTNGNLPTGLSMNAGGLVTGTPTTVGSYTSTVTVTDAAGATATRSYTIQINPPPTIATPTSLPTPWNANTAYPTGNTGTVTSGTGTAQFVWTENLPPGLNINSSTGAITGTPTNAGNYPNASITVTDAAGATATKLFPMVINPQLGFQSGTPNTAEQGVPYTFTVVPSGGTSPFTYSSTGFPVAGVNMVGNTISGTPTTPGSYPISVTIKDATNATTTKNYTFTVVAPVTFSGTLHDWTVGRSYSAVSLTANGGTGTRTFSAAPGTLPPGMTISSNGSVTGTPTATGSFSPQITISDTAGGSQTQTLPLTINPAPIIATTSLPDGERTVLYTGATLALQAATGTAPITWQASGLAASGLTLSSGGVISGTPTAGGNFNVTFTALDAAGVSTQKMITLVIAQAPQVGSQTLPQWTVNVPNYTAQLNAASGGSGTGYTYAVTSGSLPGGLTMSNTGAISGTPTANGTFNFTVTVTDSLGGTGTVNEQIIINAAPVVTTVSLPNGALNSAYTGTNTSTGGTPNLVWSETGTLPTGLNFDTSTGAITGTPTQQGTFPISVTVTDALGVASAAKPLSITISPFGMTSMVMVDNDNDGKVDRVVVTFNAPLVTINQTSTTTQWTIANAPGGATKNSVSASGNVATLFLNEGSVNTAVGTFTVALAPSATGIRTPGGTQASFPATVPTDGARPVATGAVLANGGGSTGKVNAGDTITLTYSEPLSVGTICAGWANDANPQSTTATVTMSSSGNEPITFGAPCTNIGQVQTNENYLTSGTRTFAGSTIAWNPSTKALTITLAGGAGGSTNNSSQQAQNATYTPSNALADPAGNAMLGNAIDDPNNTRF